MACNGSIISGTPIAVDYWKSGEAGVWMYFCSHAHGNHTKGLSPSWRDTVYCSPLTKALLKHKFQISDELLVELEEGRSHTLLLTEDDYVNVTPIPANHCPGAVMFLFEGYFGRVLYTGDFRYTPSMIKEPPLSLKQPVDVLYLDNTYCEARCQFPSRRTAARKIISLIEKQMKEDEDSQIIICVRSLGKEDLLEEIAEHFERWVVISNDSMEQMKLLERKYVFTVNSEDSNIHAINIPQVSNRMVSRWQKDYGENCLVIIPSALYTGLDGSPFINNPNVVIVPYSDHSSYSELTTFVKFIHPKKVVPIVRKETRGPLGLDYMQRSDMSCFARYLDTTDPEPIKVPDTVKRRMQSGVVSAPLPAKRSIKRRHSNPRSVTRQRTVPKGIQYTDSPQKSNPAQSTALSGTEEGTEELSEAPKVSDKVETSEKNEVNKEIGDQEQEDDSEKTDTAGVKSDTIRDCRVEIEDIIKTSSLGEKSNIAHEVDADTAENGTAQRRSDTVVDSAEASNKETMDNSVVDNIVEESTPNLDSEENITEASVEKIIAEIFDIVEDDPADIIANIVGNSAEVSSETTNDNADVNQSQSVESTVEVADSHTAENSTEAEASETVEESTEVCTAEDNTEASVSADVEHSTKSQASDSVEPSAQSEPEDNATSQTDTVENSTEAETVKERHSEAPQSSTEDISTTSDNAGKQSEDIHSTNEDVQENVVDTTESSESQLQQTDTTSENNAKEITEKAQGDDGLTDKEDLLPQTNTLESDVITNKADGDDVDLSSQNIDSNTDANETDAVVDSRDLSSRKKEDLSNLTAEERQAIADFAAEESDLEEVKEQVAKHLRSKKKVTKAKTRKRSGRRRGRQAKETCVEDTEEETTEGQDLNKREVVEKDIEIELSSDKAVVEDNKEKPSSRRTRRQGRDKISEIVMPPTELKVTRSTSQDSLGKRSGKEDSSLERDSGLEITVNKGAESKAKTYQRKRKRDTDKEEKEPSVAEKKEQEKDIDSGMESPRMRRSRRLRSGTEDENNADDPPEEKRSGKDKDLSPSSGIITRRGLRKLADEENVPVLPRRGKKRSRSESRSEAGSVAGTPSKIPRSTRSRKDDKPQKESSEGHTLLLPTSEKSTEQVVEEERISTVPETTTSVPTSTAETESIAVQASIAESNTAASVFSSSPTTVHSPPIVSVRETRSGRQQATSVSQSDASSHVGGRRRWRAERHRTKQYLKPIDTDDELAAAIADADTDTDSSCIVGEMVEGDKRLGPDDIILLPAEIKQEPEDTHEEDGRKLKELDDPHPRRMFMNISPKDTYACDSEEDIFADMNDSHSHRHRRSHHGTADDTDNELPDTWIDIQHKEEDSSPVAALTPATSTNRLDVADVDWSTQPLPTPPRKPHYKTTKTPRNAPPSSEEEEEESDDNVNQSTVRKSRRAKQRKNYKETDSDSKETTDYGESEISERLSTHSARQSHRCVVRKKDRSRHGDLESEGGDVTENVSRKYPDRHSFVVRKRPSSVIRRFKQKAMDSEVESEISRKIPTYPTRHPRTLGQRLKSTNYHRYQETDADETDMSEDIPMHRSRYSNRQAPIQKRSRYQETDSEVSNISEVIRKYPPRRGSAQALKPHRSSVIRHQAKHDPSQKTLVFNLIEALLKYTREEEEKSPFLKGSKGSRGVRAQLLREKGYYLLPVARRRVSVKPIKRMGGRSTSVIPMRRVYE